jgi:amino acid transporter
VRGHQLLLCLAGLVLLTAVNLRGIAESARALIAPTLLSITAIGLVILVGLVRSRPAATIGDPTALAPTEAIGVLLVLKAFSRRLQRADGVEAIANAVPTFRAPRIRNAQRTELMLGARLGVMLLGLAVLIARFQIAPREHVTVLAQLTAAALGTGPLFTLVGLAGTAVLLLAANTSYGGLPVLLSLLARDLWVPTTSSAASEPLVRWWNRWGMIAGS